MIAHILLLSAVLMVANSDVKEVVQEFHALETEQAEIDFISQYENSTDPSILGYVASISMKQAECTKNPFSKLRVFNSNKKVLEELISQNESNVHLRYVRLLTQENTPGILGYNENLEEDKEFLNKKMKIADETDYLDAYIKANTSL